MHPFNGGIWITRRSIAIRGEDKNKEDKRRGEDLRW
jgi:hypothetical protein